MLVDAPGREWMDRALAGQLFGPELGSSDLAQVYPVLQWTAVESDLMPPYAKYS
jgi:hypothetical protein